MQGYGFWQMRRVVKHKIEKNVLWRGWVGLWSTSMDLPLWCKQARESESWFSHLVPLALSTLPGGQSANAQVQYGTVETACYGGWRRKKLPLWSYDQSCPGDYLWFPGSYAEDHLWLLPRSWPDCFLLLPRTCYLLLPFAKAACHLSASWLR